MLPLPKTLLRRLRTVRGRLRDGQGLVGIAAARLARAARLAAVGTRLRAPELAVVRCGRGAEVSGLFSEVAAVIGFLDHYERCRRRYAGVRVEFGDGLYYEPSFGANWWNYYFEPIDFGGRDAPPRVVGPHYHDLCANRVEREMPRARAAELVARYVRLAPPVREQCDHFVRARWNRRRMIGLHYRGTDKSEDAPRVPYEGVAAVLRERTTALGEGCGIFLATDEQAFLQFMLDQFPGRVVYRDMFRSIDGRAIDVVNADSNHQKGLDAVIDSVLLSRTDLLIRTASNLSLCSTFFNPAVPDLLLNRERWAKHLQ